MCSRSERISVSKDKGKTEAGHLKLTFDLRKPRPVSHMHTPTHFKNKNKKISKRIERTLKDRNV